MSSIRNEACLYFKTLFYNKFCDWNYVFDTAFSPLFWLLDSYGKKLGQAFVVVCCMLMISIITISYSIGLPHWWEKSPVTTIGLLIFGNWLKINCIFHYVMGIISKPGYPPQDILIQELASICKKCLQPKPHRTHHCSICNTCILQMDHHCPWLNNCVGHFNRRYFFMFMVYIEISMIFLMIFGIDIAYKELWLHYVGDEAFEIYGYPVDVNTSLPKEEWVVKPTNLKGSSIISEEQCKSFRRKAVTFAAVICLGVSIAIGSLLYNHSKMISRGETSIEKHINNSERKKYAARDEIYINPYDFGALRNWTIFLGIKNGSSRSWFHILFPSLHEPFGDGITWPTINSTETELEIFFNRKSL